MNQKGFANIILVVVIVILLGMVGYFTFVKKSEPVVQQPTPTPATTQTKTPVSQTQTPPTSGSPQLFTYAQGNIKAEVVNLVIKENNVTPIKGVDMSTGKETYGPSVYYAIDIKLKVLSINGIDSKYLQAGSEISMHYGWEATKPKFLKGDTIETGIRLVGTSSQYNSSNGYWILEDDTNLWVR